MPTGMEFEQLLSVQSWLRGLYGLPVVCKPAVARSAPSQSYLQPMPREYLFRVLSNTDRPLLDFRVEYIGTANKERWRHVETSVGYGAEHNAAEWRSIVG